MAIPNTTPTPNELYNGEMAKMTDTELRIVLITTRATLGWEKDKETKMRKQEDWISHYQLIKKSGRSSRSITKAIDNCVKMGWIEIRDKNGELLNTKNKRIGNKMYFRLGRLFLDKLETPAESKEVEEQTPAESKIEESKIEESKAYKRNTIQKKLYTKEAVATATADIPKLINLFKDISPNTYKDWFKNKTERSAAEKLLEKHSLEKYENLLLNFLPKLNVMSYIGKDSKAFKPSELLRNLDKIIAKIKELQIKRSGLKPKIEIV